MTISAISGSSGNMPPQGIDPDTYAQQYATQNGISVEEAKEQLKTKFGDPKQPDNSTSTAVSDALSSGNQNSTIPKEAWELQALGIPLDVIQQGDNAIKNFAEENNITLPEKQSGANLNFDW